MDTVYLDGIQSEPVQGSAPSCESKLNRPTLYQSEIGYFKMTLRATCLAKSATDQPGFGHRILSVLEALAAGTGSISNCPEHVSLVSPMQGFVADGWIKPPTASATRPGALMEDRSV